MSHNPYAPPQANSLETPALDAPPALWNPNAAANWSLLLSPAFGAYLHMKNWQALGDSAKAANSKRWVMVYAIFLLVGAVSTVFYPDSKSVDAYTKLIGVVMLFAWYFASARAQAKYVKAQYGNNYPRRGWLKPFLAAFAVWIGVVLVLGMAFAISIFIYGE